MADMIPGLQAVFGSQPSAFGVSAPPGVGSPFVGSGIMTPPPTVQPIQPISTPQVQAPGSAATAFANSGAVNSFRNPQVPMMAPQNAPSPAPPQPTQSQGAQQQQAMQQLAKGLQSLGKLFSGGMGGSGANSPSQGLLGTFGYGNADGMADQPEQGNNQNVGDTTDTPQNTDTGSLSGGLDSGDGGDVDMGDSGGFDFSGGDGFSF